MYFKEMPALYGIKIKIENKQSFFGKKVARNCLKDQFQ
jgi:hypothetical protein